MYPVQIDILPLPVACISIHTYISKITKTKIKRNSNYTVYNLIIYVENKNDIEMRKKKIHLCKLQKMLKKTKL